MSVKIVVTGGRSYDDVSMVHGVLDSFNIERIYVGDATGADELAREYAQFYDIPVTVFKADWDKHGKSAGPIRNGEMLDAAGENAIVVAFLGGIGTRNCTNQAHERGMIVLRVEE
jgi:hypothetical protein